MSDEKTGPAPAPAPFPVQSSAYLQGYKYRCYRYPPVPKGVSADDVGPDVWVEFSPEEMFGIVSILARATSLTTVNGVNFIGKLFDLIRVKE